MALHVGLAHTEIKIRRAHKRLEELKAVVADFRKNGYRITRHDDPGKRLHHVLISLKVATDALGGLPGEFAYSLRSGLDNLAWQLALLTTDVPNRQTAFPISGVLPSTAANYWKAISDIPAPAAAIINSLQPHNRGAAFKDDLLWQLNELCNIDKHQLIAVAGTVLEVGIDGVRGATQSRANHAFKVTVPLAQKEKLKLHVHIPRLVFGQPIDVVDGNSEFEIGIERFEEIYDFIRNDVIPRFKKFFP